MSTRMKNICGEFHRNHSTVYRDIESHKTDVNGKRMGEWTVTAQSDGHQMTRRHNALCLILLAAA